MMKKYYSEVFSGTTIFSIVLLTTLDIVPPILSILPVYTDNFNSLIWLFAAFADHLMLCSFLPLIFGFIGPLPYRKKSMESFAQMYNSTNGNPTCFFMNCVIPARRRELLDLPVKLMLTASAAHCISTLVLSLMSGEELARISTAAVVIDALVIISAPLCNMASKKRYSVIGAVTVVLAGVLILGTNFLKMLGYTSALPILPLPIRIAISITAFLSNVLFFRSTVYKGEFARNGEKIS